MQVWYMTTVDRPPPPAIVALATMTAEREDLYWHVPPPGELIPVGKLPLLVDYGILENGDIRWEVCRIFLNCLGGHSGMRAEHLCQWMISVTWDDSPDATTWQKFSAIVHAAICDETLDKDCMWQTFVLIPEGRRYFQGIELVEIFWKAVASLLNRWPMSAITYCDTLHRFMVGGSLRLDTYPNPA